MTADEPQPVAYFGFRGVTWCVRVPAGDRTSPARRAEVVRAAVADLGRGIRPTLPAGWFCGPADGTSRSPRT